jgi:hypothetical protein
MREDRAPFFGRERGMIAHRVDQRFVNLADVVEEGDALECAHLMVSEVGRIPQNECVSADAAEMLACLVVGRFDRVQERFEGRGGQSFGAPAPHVFEAEQAE